MPLIHPEHDPNLHCPPVIQVPDGMTADEARQILADRRPWVPLPSGPTEAHVGARVRREGVSNGGVHYSETGVVLRISDGFAYLSQNEGFGVAGSWFVHPDDVPADPDADLIAALVSEGEFSEVEARKIAPSLRRAGVVVREADAR